MLSTKLRLRFCWEFEFLVLTLGFHLQQVGDGDCGTTLARGARQAMLVSDESELFRALSVVCEQMGGSSGAVLSILFSSSSKLDVDSLLFGCSRVMKHGGAKREGSRTLLDALIPALEVLKDGKTIQVQNL
jgi:triose/dihydroxyacetone kinase / FAD-AMP lyase (cyclizing)